MWDSLLSQARKIFKKICPDEEFLPKPPHPDDIIFVDDEETPATGNQSSVLSADLDVDGEGVDCTESKQIQRDAKEEATESESVTESNVTENTEEGQEKSEKKWHQKIILRLEQRGTVERVVLIYQHLELIGI